MEALIPDKKIKDLFKQAIIEAIEEKKELFHDLLLEVMEDLAMVRAIQLTFHTPIYKYSVFF